MVTNSGVRVLNSPDVIAWNSNKKYLLDLQEKGVSLLPTILISQSDQRLQELPESRTGWVVKPTVGSSAKDVKRFLSDQESVVKEYAKQLAEKTGEALIQPFAEEILNGEVSFVFFGDRFSHACRKVPDNSDFRVQPEYGGHDSYFDANPDQIEQARVVLKATGFDLLYARVDMIEVAGKFVLMELELIEPYLFFGYNEAPKDFILALKKII